MTELKPDYNGPETDGADLDQERIDEIAATDMTFQEIEALYGEEAAIQVGIARDPDAPEWTEEDFARARPAIEVFPELVERHRRTRGKQRAPTKVHLNIRLDADVVARLREDGEGWQTRLNDILRRAVLGSEA